MPSEAPVALVAGGGIGGLAAALALHKAGIAVKVFEKASVLAEVGAGINLLPGGAQVLHDLGLEELLQSTEPDGGAGIQTTELVYGAPSGTVVLREARGKAAGFAAPQYSIHRAWLHRALLNACEERIGKENIHCGHALSSFEQDAAGVTAHFDVAKGSGQASFKGAILIGADGIRSQVRAQLFPGERASFTGWRIYRGVLEIDSQIYDGRTMLLLGTGQVTSVLYPVCERRRRDGKTLLNWGINCADAVLAPELRGEPGEESWSRRVPKTEFKHLIDDWVFPKGCFPDAGTTYSQIVAATPADQITCYALFDRDPISTWTVGRVTLLGDAAHPLLPFGSQGAGQAMLDVAALYNALSSCGGDLPAALKAYEGARVEQAAKVVLSNRNMGPTKLLHMFDDAVGTRDLAAQERWVAENNEMLVKFSQGYLGMTGLTGQTKEGEKPAAAAGAGTPFDNIIGFGTSPALVVVDFSNAYTEPGSPWYCGDPYCGVVKAVKESVELLAQARERGIPIVFTRVVYSADGLDKGLIFLKKVPKLITWTEDNPLTSICPEVAPIKGEEVIIKKHPGAFFGTPLLSYLNARGIDTVLLIGCSTSGCIRATALEGMQHGFRVVIPRECVGDRTPAVHDANLLDCHAKICDVLPKAEVMKYLARLPAEDDETRTLS